MIGLIPKVFFYAVKTDDINGEKVRGMKSILGVAGIIAFCLVCWGCGPSPDSGHNVSYKSGLRSDTTLASLDFSEPVILSPSFSPEVIDYSAYVYNSVNEIAVTPRTTDRFAVLSVNGSALESGEESDLVPLEAGQTRSIDIRVTAENGDEKQYLVRVSRSDKSMETCLSDLVVDSGILEPAFDESPEGPWTVSVPRDQWGLTVSMTACDENVRSVTIDNTPFQEETGTKTIALDPGVTKTVILKVDAEEEGISTSYVLRATRDDYEPSDQTEITSIALAWEGAAAPILVPSITSNEDMHVAVPWNWDTVTVTPAPVDPPDGKGYPVITVDDHAVPYGVAVERGTPRTLTIHVVAEDRDTTRDYRLVIEREACTDTSLAGLDLVSDYHTLVSWFSVDQDGPWYALLRYNVESYRIMAETRDPLAVVTARFQGGAPIAFSGSESDSIAIDKQTVHIIDFTVTAENPEYSQDFRLTVFRYEFETGLGGDLQGLRISTDADPSTPLTLSPAFDPEIYDYNLVQVLPDTVGSLVFDPTQSHEGQIISVDGYGTAADSWPQAGQTPANVPIKPGNNTLTVYSQSAIGTATLDRYRSQYRIHVFRAYSGDASLSRLRVEGLTEDIDVEGPVTGTYDMATPEGVRTISVTPTTQDPYASSVSAHVVTGKGQVYTMAMASGETSALSLESGVNQVNLTVVADDGVSSETYVLRVKTPVSSDASISYVHPETGAIQGNGHPWRLIIDEPVAQAEFTIVPGDSLAGILLIDGSGEVVTPADGASHRYKVDLLPDEDMVFTILVTAENGNTETHDLIVCPEIATEETGAGRLSGITVTMGQINSSPRPLNLAFDQPVTDGDASVFSSSVFDYAVVVYGFDTVNVAVTTDEGTGVSSVSINGADADVTGAVPTPVYLYNGKGYVTPVKIVVVDGAEDIRTYTVHVKLLNIQEFFRGIYGVSINTVMDSKWSLEKPSGLGSDVVIEGDVSGRLHWYVDPSTNGCVADSIMNVVNYNDGQIGLAHNNHGFVANGETLGCLNSSKTGYLTGGYRITTPEGGIVADLDYHLYIYLGDTAEAADSYTDCTYMGQTVRMRYYGSGSPMGQSPFDPAYFPDYDYETSWEPGY